MGNLRGMILAAGLGTRMGAISRHMAKPAVPFLGLPMIEHSIGVLRSGGISEIIINLHHLPETVKAILGDGSRLGVSITYSHEDPVLGTGGGIGKVRDFFGSDAFVVINSDVLMDLDLADVLSAHRNNDVVATLVLRPDKEEHYGGVWLDAEGIVRQIESVPEGADTDNCRRLMFAGVHVIEQRWFDYAPAGGEYDSIRDVYGPMLSANERLAGYVFRGRWVDLGSARRLLAGSMEHLVGSITPASVSVGEGAEVEHSILAHGTEIGKRCEIKDSIFLGPAKIGDGCKIRRCIICPGAEVAPASVLNEQLVDGDNLVSLDSLPF